MQKKICSLVMLLTMSLVAFAQTKVPVHRNLEIVTITPHVLEHISYMEDPTGRIPCNGLIYISGKEAIVMDTPPDNKLSKKLLDWFAVTYPGITITGVIVSHFHKDAAGGLAEFHKRGIKSYGNKMTADIAWQKGITAPYNTFTDELKLKVGGERVICRYFGEGHSKDGIVTWLPAERVLFGGCMIKAVGFGKGNIADANLAEYANTVAKVQAEFGKQARIVVPGHGENGGPELLQYTFDLFDAE